MARVLDYLLADEAPHAHTGARWSAPAREALDRTGTPVQSSELRAGLDATAQPGVALPTAGGAVRSSLA